MITILSGTALLLVTLAAFSLFSFKMPKGQAAMSGMADAAVATFLVEAILNYIAGDIFGLEFLKEVGITSGTMGGIAAAAMVPIKMGASPVLSICAGVAAGGIRDPSGVYRRIPDRLCSAFYRKEAAGGTECHRGCAGGILSVARGGVLRGSRRHESSDYHWKYRFGGDYDVPGPHGIPAGRDHQDDLYFAAEFNGSYGDAGYDRPSDGDRSDRLLRRIFYQRHDL
jgi:hypothetical protein